MPKTLLDELTGNSEKDFAIKKQIWLLWKKENNITQKMCFGCTLKYAIEWLTEESKKK